MKNIAELTWYGLTEEGIKILELRQRWKYEAEKQIAITTDKPE